MTNFYIKFSMRNMLIFSCLILSACSGNKFSRGGIVDELTEPVEVSAKVKAEFEKALDLLKEKKYKQAIKLLDALVKVEPRVTAPFINLGMAYAKVNEYEKAEKSLLSAVNLRPAHPAANNELGLVYRKMGRFNKAKKAYEVALGAYPDYLPARKNLGILCDVFLHNLDCALENYEQYLKYSPDDKAVKIWIADVKRRRK